MCFYANDACVCMCVMRVCLQMMCVMCEYDIVLHVLLLYIYIYMMCVSVDAICIVLVVDFLSGFAM